MNTLRQQVQRLRSLRSKLGGELVSKGVAERAKEELAPQVRHTLQKTETKILCTAPKLPSLARKIWCGVDPGTIRFPDQQCRAPMGQPSQRSSSADTQSASHHIYTMAR